MADLYVIKGTEVELRRALLEHGQNTHLSSEDVNRLVRWLLQARCRFTVRPLGLTHHPRLVCLHVEEAPAFMSDFWIRASVVHPHAVSFPDGTIT